MSAITGNTSITAISRYRTAHDRFAWASITWSMRWRI